jgi:hypothetical protein
MDSIFFSSISKQVKVKVLIHSSLISEIFQLTDIPFELILKFMLKLNI